MKILIVGSTGFVGQNFLEFLEDRKEIEVLVLDRNISENTPKGYTWEQINSIPFVEIQHVFYLTGKAHDLKKTADEQAYFDINVGLTRTFLEAAEKQNFNGSFVFLSSVKAIADEVEEVLLEDSQASPVTPYGKSKLEAEQVILNSYLASNAVILRPCMIHGKGNKGNLNQLFSFVKKGIPNILGSFQNERSLLSVDNLIFVFEQSIVGNLPSGVYQVADNGVISTNRIMALIGEVLGKKVSVFNLPKPLIGLIAKFGDVLPIPINSERLQKLTENYRVSSEKIQKAMNKNFPVSLEEGLKKTIQSFE